MNGGTNTAETEQSRQLREEKNSVVGQLKRFIEKRLAKERALGSLRLVWRDSLLTAFLLLTATIICFFLFRITPNSGPSIAMLYMLMVFLVACLTSGTAYGLVAAACSVVITNVFFTYPFGHLNFTLTGYPIAFFVMFALAVLASAMMTAIKRQTQALAAHEKELRELEKEKMRADLLRAVSHDLRTPLTSIIGTCGYYIDGQKTLSEHKKTELVTRIQEDSEWLLNMVENLLLVTRINNETTTVKKRMEFVEEVVCEALTRLKKRNFGVRVEAVLPDEMLEAPMDAMLIEQVLINLMENALFHAKSEKPIRCVVEDGGDCVYFRVQDSGVGIAPERLPHIFDGSLMEDGAPSDGKKGMGIGLTICKAIVTAHGGEIYAKNLPEGGAEFGFALQKEEKGR